MHIEGCIQVVKIISMGNHTADCINLSQIISEGKRKERQMDKDHGAYPVRKKSWIKPKLHVYGTIEDIKLTVSNLAPDDNSARARQLRLLVKLIEKGLFLILA